MIVNPTIFGKRDDSFIKESAINFYDYDGTLLYSYTPKEFEAYATLPPLPKREELACERWNYTQGEINDCVEAFGVCNVGAIYKSDTTKIHIHVEDDTSSLEFCCYPNGKVTINWGDGNESTLEGSSLNEIKSAIHTYADSDSYVISLIVDKQVAFRGSAEGGADILKSQTGALAKNQIYQNCIKEINLGSGVIIGDYAFANCKHLEKISIPSGIEQIASHAFSYCQSLDSIFLPTGLSIIKDHAFEYCLSLNVIGIPNSLTSIESYAFSNCQALKEFIAFSAPLANEGVFQYCSSLSKVNAAPGEQIGNYIFRECSSLKNFNLPEGINTIGDYAFDHCTSLDSIKIPSTVEEIGSQAFAACFSLKSVEFLGENETKIETLKDYAFSYCTSLNRVKLPNSITSIANYLFYYCPSLASVTLLGDIKTVGAGAFNSCSGVSYFDFTKCTGVPVLASVYAFSGIDEKCEIRVPLSLIGDWGNSSEHPNWVVYKDNIRGV